MDSETINCPKCNKLNKSKGDIDENFPKNISLVELLEDSIKNNHEKCDIHLVPLDTICIDCEVLTCYKCFILSHEGH